MQGIFYAFENGEYPKIHLLRFFPESEYVLAKTIHSATIEDLSKELKKFDIKGHSVVGPPEEIYVGAFLEGSKSISFKIGNEVNGSVNGWAQQDILTCKGTVISDDAFELTVTSKTFK